MKSLFNVKKHFAIFAIMATAMMLPNFAYAYDANCNHESDKVTDGVCACGAGVMYFYTKDNNKPGFGTFSDDAFGPGAKFVKVIEDGTNPKRFAIICEAPITKIPTGMFGNSTILCSIDIPNSVTKIEMNAFNNCDALTAVVIPENVKTIGAWAFNGCDALTSIVIPESVEEIKMEAFRGCDNLTSVEVKGENTKINESAFKNTKVTDVSGTLPQVEAITGVAADKSKDQQPQPQVNVKDLKVALTDGFDKSLFPNATITTDSYTRVGVTNAWGTICLPFDVESNQNIQYYQLSGVDPATGVMSFAKMDEVKANTPCVFQNLSGEATLEFSSSLPAEMNRDNVEYRIFEDDDWYIIGTYQNLVLNVAAGGNEEGQNLYYISNNKFWHAEGTLRMKPFRAYFQYKGSSLSAAASRFSVAVSTNEMSTDLRSSSIEEEDGVLYDLLGNRVTNMVEGRIYILNGRKVMFKK